MAQTQIAGGRIGTLKNLKKTLKASGGGPLSWIPKEGITVRFLTEPDEWFGFYEHYDETIKKSYPCIEGDCPGCNTDQKRTFRYLANVLDVENDKVLAMLLPKSLANRLTTRFEKNDTLMDRDYELFKTGEGLDTEYDLEPEAPKKRATTKYELIDLGDALQKAWDAVWGDEDEDEEEEKPSARSRARRNREATSRGRGRGRAKKDDDDDDEEEEDEEPDDEDEDEDEESAIPETLEELADLGLAALKEIADEIGVSVKPDKGKTRISAVVLRDRIATELGLDEEDEEDEDEDEDDDVDEYEEFTEDELNSFSMTELREIARDYDIKSAKLKKPALIEAILEAQEA